MASCHYTSSSTPKIERRIIEKNRRNHMKSLYSKLYSLLPNHDPSKEAVPLPDRLEEAEKYIKSLQMRLEKYKEKKETLLGRKRSHSCITDFKQALKSPQIEIREMGPAVNVVLISGQEDKFIFHEIIRLIHEEGAEVVNASFSVVGNSIRHVIHAKIGELAPKFEAARVSNRLREFVNGSISDVESQSESLEFEIQPDMWEFEIPQILPLGVYSN
ncbi:unnamed protein product [Camellia sinensis]